MATSFRTLFDYFLNKVNDRQICSLLTDEDLINILNLYQKDSTSVYFKIIKQDVTDIKSPEFYRQSFTGDDVEVNFVISQWSSGDLDISTEPYCEVDGVILTNGVDYTFNISNLTFTLTNPPVTDAEISCGYDFVGEYNGDYTDEELWVIASGMVYSWSSSKYYNSENLKNRMSTKDFKTFSPAELLNRMNELRVRAKYELRQDTVSYSFNDFTGFN